MENFKINLPAIDFDRFDGEIFAQVKLQKTLSENENRGKLRYLVNMAISRFPIEVLAEIAYYFPNAWEMFWKQSLEVSQLKVSVRKLDKGKGIYRSAMSWIADQLARQKTYDVIVRRLTNLSEREEFKPLMKRLFKENKK